MFQLTEKKRSLWLHKMREILLNNKEINLKIEEIM
jgi:hypothetical protein